MAPRNTLMYKMSNKGGTATIACSARNPSYADCADALLNLCYSWATYCRGSCRFSLFCCFVFGILMIRKHVMVRVIIFDVPCLPHGSAPSRENCLCSCLRGYGSTRQPLGTNADK